MASSSAATSLEVELLLDRLLSASTPTDCLDSLEQLLSQCKYARPKKQTSSQKNDPKKARPSQEDEREQAQKEAEAAEEERQSIAIDTLLRNGGVLNALCSLVASSALPSQTKNTNNSSSSGNSSGGMEVEGGDVAACELLLEVLPSSSPSATTATEQKSGATTTEALQKQRQQKRRLEFISKTLLHFHESSNNDSDRARMDPGGADAELALTPSLLDCLCAASASNPPSVYARVLSLQLLQALLSASPGALREQLMTAPDGINRLVDLLGHSSMGADAAEVPEEVRNQAILFLTSLASSSSMLARLITFSEGYDRALKIALETTGNGTSLSSGFSSGGIAMDCLDLCLALAHADDVARELFLGGGDGRGNLDRLSRLVDLRGGERFRDGERNGWWDGELRERRRARLLKSKKKKEGSEMKKSESKNSVGEEKKDKPQKQGGRKGKRGKQRKEDDLDDILALAGGTSTTTTSTSTKETGTATTTQPNPSRPPTEPQGPPTPYLTPNETKIIGSILNLLLVLLHDGDHTESAAHSTITAASRSKRRGRAKTLLSHDLARFIVDCALYTLPPPGVDYVSAVPTPELQMKALVAMAALGSLGDTISDDDVRKAEGEKDEKVVAKLKKEAEEESQLQTQLLFETMPIYLQGRVTGIDRLMYLCCTGAYTPQVPSLYNDDEDVQPPEAIASLLSTYAISTFRSCLPKETASRMVLHALAPPMSDETDDMVTPMEPPVITRLVMTLADNLRFLQSQQIHNDDEKAEVDMTDVYRATIGASGAAGALGVFLTCGEVDTREMLLRLAPPPPRIAEGVDNGDHAEEAPSASLIDFVLQHVAAYDPDLYGENDALRASAAYVTGTLLRLLSEWVIGMPRAVSEVLSSPSSVSIGVLVRSKKSSGGKVAAAEAVPALSGLLLGLCLEYMADSDGNAAGGDSPNMDNAAWTLSTMMNLIQSQGVGKYLNMLDEWKRRPLPLPYSAGTERSGMERRAFSKWYGGNVTLVRRRVVLALAGSRGDDDSESDGEEGGNSMSDGSKSSLRSLRKLVSSQAQENEDLQTKLEEALLQISSQATQIKELKRVGELGGTSAETNDMIDEYTEKVTELEKTKADLMKDAEHQKKIQEEALKAKEEEMDKLKKEMEDKVATAQIGVEEMRRDNVTLSEEMSGLSAAYNSLEEQYHRSNISASAVGGGSTPAAGEATEMTAGGETAAEDGGAGASSGEAAAENPGRSNSHEVQSLREENFRLQEDVRAANEWMTMAVSKMEEMGGENESLTRSLEEARSTQHAAAGPNNAESLSLQNELEALRKEAQSARDEAEATKLSAQAEVQAKEGVLAGQQALVQSLEGQMEEMKLAASSTNNDDTSASAELEEVKQSSARQVEELESLRQANKDAQDWMQSAVTHVDTLTKEVSEKKEQLDELTAKLEAAKMEGEETSSSRSELEAKVAGLEKTLAELTLERDELQKSLAERREEMSALKEANEDLRKTAEESQQAAQDSSGREGLQSELDQAKAENVTLQSNLAEFQSWSETAQSRLAEVEAELQQITAERDLLKSQLEKSASEDAKSNPEYQSLIKSLEEQLLEKNDQLERMQDQLIEDADEHEAENEKMHYQLEEEKQRVDDLAQQEKGLSEMVDKLTAEKERLASSLAEKQAEIGAMKAIKDDADTRAAETNRRISELESAKSSAEAQVDKLMTLEDQGHHNLDDQIISLTAERNELQSQLDDINEDHQETQASLERISMENGNMSARTRALEQDNKSLEYQFKELEGKMKHKVDIFEVAKAEKSALESALEEMKSSSDEAVQSVSTMQARLEEQEKEASDAIAQWEVRCSTLEESGGGVIQQWEERVKILEGDVASLETQLEQQEKDAADAVSQWEARCSALEANGGDVIQQWEERVKSLDGDVASLETQLEQQGKEAADAITQWEARCSALEEGDEGVIHQWEERVELLEADILSMQSQMEQQEREAAEAVAQWEARCTVLEETSEGVIHQWDDRVKSLEADVAALEEQLEQQEKEAAETIEQWEARCSTLEESGEGVIHQWDDRVKSLEGDIETLEIQLENQENEAAEAIAQWETRCSTLEESGEGIIHQWEERVQTLEGEVVSLENQLEQQVNEAAGAIAQWETRCSTLEESGEGVAHQWEERAQSLEGDVKFLQNQLEQKESESSEALSQIEMECSEAKAEIETLSNQKQSFESNLAEVTLQVGDLNKIIEEKDEALAGSDEQVSELSKELLETQQQSEQVVKQWMERSDQLETNVNELEDTIQEHENGANEAIAQWEDRCTTLNEKIESLEAQLAAHDVADTAATGLRAELSKLMTKLEASYADNKNAQDHLKETKDSLALRVKEWKDKELSLTSTVDQLEVRCSELQTKLGEDVPLLDRLKDKCTVLEDENRMLQQDTETALKESEESQVLVLELKEELRYSKEELQSFATDQFTVKATEMATQALRQQMVETRSQYTVDQETLNSEREARCVAEEEVARLKSDLALLAQAKEYNENVDVYVRKMAKKVSAENVKTERKEMEQLRTTLERLREELGSCRWKERESEEKAANARLQMSILEQEVSAAKTDLALLEQAQEELENSKIEMSVSLEYRIEVLENDLLITGQSHEDEINGIKAELAQANQERDNLAHKLEQSEKANAALVYSTSHDGPDGEESESEVIKLQLERAQLLAKINEMGSDLERRVREAVAAQASSSEAELIVEKQSRKSVDSSLADALSELDDVKSQLADESVKNRSGEVANKEQAVEDLEDTLDDLRLENNELANQNKLLQTNLDTSDKENKSTIDELRNKLQKAEERLRSDERESRFEAAMASEIANLRASTSHDAQNGTQKHSQSLILRGIDQNMRPSALFDEGSKESIDRNSAYIIEMYDYVVELKQSITEERLMYKDLLAEHEDLLALLGQAGLEGM